MPALFLVPAGKSSPRPQSRPDRCALAALILLLLLLGLTVWATIALTFVPPHA